MTSECFVIGAGDGHTIAVHEWRAADPVGSLIWLHGMAEPGPRYRALGETLAEHGWNLYCPDHRGPGARLAPPAPPRHPAAEGGRGPGGWFSPSRGTCFHLTGIVIAPTCRLSSVG